MFPTLWFRIGWVVIGLVALIWEILSLIDSEKGDTLTEQIRWLVQFPPAWYVTAGFLIWFIDHFLLHDVIWEHLFRRG